MTTTAYILFLLSAAALLWNIISAARIAQKLEKSNVAQSAATMRYMPWKYLQAYAELTRNESGKIGALYYHYIFSILVLLGSGLTLVILLISSS